ncbi:MAG: RIP metalloprotease RseP [Alphaproteobacteria bacterium]|nr:RIP metalloprotease RseP [Alphaproteobacteria bacterium]
MFSSLLDILIYWVVPVAVVITVIVFFHELGHYLVGRLFRVKIETFSIGFGRAVAGFTDRRGTYWKIGWLPVGGYVRFFGDLDVASRPDQQGGQAMTADERALALQFKPLWQRALVVAAGPIANFVLAIAFFMVPLLILGRALLEPLVGSVTPGSPAERAGIRAGDLVRQIDNTSISDFGQIPEIVQTGGGQPLTISLQRGAQSYTVHVTPVLAQRNQLGSTETVPFLGIGSARNAKVTVVSYGALAAFREAAHETWQVVADSGKGLAQLVTGQAGSRQLHGTASIVVMTGHVAKLGILPLVQLIAFLSVSIGLINLFPIPVLDGGHLLYYACEAVLGRPLGERAQEVGFRVGLALILGLVLFSFWNDLAHHLNLF